MLIKHMVYCNTFRKFWKIKTDMQKAQKVDWR